MNRIHTTRFCSRTVAKACTAAALLTGVMTMTGCMVASDTWYARVEEGDRSDHDTGSMPFDFSGAGGMDNSYTLTARNDEGDEAELTFGSDDPIPDGTWLQIETQMLRGVTSWKAVQEAEVSEKAREDK